MDRHFVKRKYTVFFHVIYKNITNRIVILVNIFADSVFIFNTRYIIFLIKICKCLSNHCLLNHTESHRLPVSPQTNWLFCYICRETMFLVWLHSLPVLVSGIWQVFTYSFTVSRPRNMRLKCFIPHLYARHATVIALFSCVIWHLRSWIQNLLHSFVANLKNVLCSSP